MSSQKGHDLFDFMQQISVEMSSEYDRIQKRATEDPGTAGDQAEENWAELLRGWLPRSYEVVTKGRIISRDGTTSPQVDLLVLHDHYPRKLLNKKVFLAAGVAAVFECKTTLKASHIAEAVATCAQIKNLFPARSGTPYKELHSPVIYGLLAHSHVWKGDGATPERNIEQKLNDLDGLWTHPRQQLDLLCVADLGAWTSSVMAFIGPRYVPDWSKLAPLYGPSGSATSSYVGHTRLHEQQRDQFTPIGALISSLSQKLAWETPALRDLAQYYRLTDLSGSGAGRMRLWPSTIYSDDVRLRVEAGRVTNGVLWDEWLAFFP